VSAPGHARVAAPGEAAPGHARVAAPGEAAAARLVIGAGCSRGCPPEELADLVEATLAGISGRVVAVATIDGRAEEPCVLALAGARGVPVRAHPAAALAEVPVPTPSAVVARHVGTASVAEAAALLAAGPGARLAVAKRRSAHATCAIAEEAAWPG
jgi:cobalt-precorrin 5A hydrolase/cobalt-precorrin 5A hydrolase/precorrin-3B C17-methyltransferase